MPRPLKDSPTRVPPNFTSEVLKRLLPSADKIKAMSPDQRKALWAKKVALEQAIRDEPIKFFKPNPGAQWDFMVEWNERLRGKYFFAGNKTGKSTGAAILAGELATGQALWGTDIRKFTYPTPNRGCYYADDFSAHKETTLPAFLSWFPEKRIKGHQRNAQGYVSEIYIDNGSVIFFRTYDQGYDKPEGKDYNWVVCDEPPPRQIYMGVWRGLVVFGGIMIIAATLLKEAWLYDELDLEFVRVYNATIYDNKWMPDQARADYVSMMTPEEKEIRVHGRPVTLTGRVYKDFKDDAPWIISEPLNGRFDDPLENNPWPIVMGVDPHERKPLHLMWGWLTPIGGIIWFDAALIQARTTKQVFDDIRAKEAKHISATRIVIMDPNRGNTPQIGGRTWANEFEENGYDVLLADDNIEMGHADVGEFLAHDLEANQRPLMVFTENLRELGKFGPIYQLSHYMWDDWARSRKTEKSPKEAVKDLNKDFPDVIRYTVRAIKGDDVSFNRFMLFDDDDGVFKITNDKPAGAIY